MYIPYDVTTPPSLLIMSNCAEFSQYYKLYSPSPFPLSKWFLSVRVSLGKQKPSQAFTAEGIWCRKIIMQVVKELRAK